VLFVSGDPQCLADPQIAVVGSRRPTPEGRKNAHGFVGQLSRVSLFITSGLAAGIDGAGYNEAGGLSIAVAAPSRIVPIRAGIMSSHSVSSSMAPSSVNSSQSAQRLNRSTSRDVFDSSAA